MRFMALAGALVDAAMAGVAARGGHQAHAAGHALLRRAARRRHAARARADGVTDQLLRDARRRRRNKAQE